MSKPTDPEWHDLMDAWQSEAPEETAPAPLSDEVRRRIRRKVKRHSYWLVLLAVSEVVVAVGMTALMLFLLDFRRPADLFALIGTVVLFAVAFYYTVRNRRGTWWPAAESTTTFVDLSIERCRRKLRTVRFIPKLLAGGVSFLAVYGIWTLLAKAAPAVKWIEFFAFLVLYPAVWLVWAAWYKRKTLRELAEWEELRRSL